MNVAPGLFFASARPAVSGLPHLITALDAELIAKVVHLTVSEPGLWHLPAPYDEQGLCDPWRDPETPFSLWGLPANQAELLAPGRFAAEALFGTQAILLDSSIDEKAVLQLAALRGQRKKDGGWYVDGFQDLPALADLLKVTRWALMPVAPDRSYGLFVVSPENAAWVEALEHWCDRAGRSRCRLVLEGDTPGLLDHPAPAEARERAVAQCIDEFLGRMQRYFRLSDESLVPRLQQRITAARQLEEAIARNRQADAGPG